MLVHQEVAGFGHKSSKCNESVCRAKEADA